MSLARVRVALLREVWGPSHIEHAHYLGIYMKQLREKLEADPVRPRHLLTETGIGYRLVGDEGLEGEIVHAPDKL
jgi:two-component system KDP operon response regulator KdpE